MKMFKNKFFVILLTIAIIMGIGTGIYAYSTKKNGKYISEIKSEVILKDANEDIQKSFKLDETKDDYIILSLEEVNEFRSGSFGIDDSELRNKIADKFDELYENPPIGSTEPMYMVKKDGSEIMVLYKEENGTNVMNFAKFRDGEWEKGQESSKGKNRLDYDSVEIE